MASLKSSYKDEVSYHATLALLSFAVGAALLFAAWEDYSFAVNWRGWLEPTFTAAIAFLSFAGFRSAVLHGREILKAKRSSREEFMRQGTEPRVE